MSKRTDKEYEKVIQEFSEAIMGVAAPLEEYLDALKEARSEVDNLIQLAEADLARAEEER